MLKSFIASRLPSINPAASEIMQLDFDGFGMEPFITQPSGSTSNFISYLSGINESGVQTNSAGVFQNAGIKAFLGNGTLLRYQGITIGYPHTISNITDDVEPLLTQGIGFHGEPVTRFTSVIHNYPEAPGGPYPYQGAIQVQRPALSPELPEFYYSLYCIPSELLEYNLTIPAQYGHWAMVTEFKDDDNVGTKYRFNLSIRKGADGLLYWRSAGDVGNSVTTYWIQDTAPGSVQLGVPTLIEVYINRPSAEADVSSGITKVWITPQGGGRTKVCDQRGGTQRIGTATLRTLFLTNAYSGGYAPYENTIWDFKLFDKYPFGPASFI